jgi:hypothetical protein
MKKVLVVVAVIFSLALITSVYAQKWDSAQEAEQLAKGKEFKFSGEIMSIDPKAKTAMVKGPQGKTALGRFDYAKYEGAYKGVEDLKVGEKIVGTGVVVNGYNWITRVADASKMPAAAGAPPAPAKK